MEWEPFDLRALDDAGQAAWDDLHAEAEAESHPEVPRQPFAYRWTRATNPRTEQRIDRFAVWSDDRSRLLGEAVLTVMETEDNRHLAYVDLNVALEARRRGLGRAAFAHLCASAERQGRTKLWLDAWLDTPGIAFLEGLGAKQVMIGRQSRVFTKDLDRPLLEGWVAKAEERAADYELISWYGPTPEEHLEAYVDCLHVMNSAPMGEADWEPEIYTPAMVQGWDARRELTGDRKQTVVARHRETGEFAGFSEIILEEKGRTSFGHQDNTGVNPAHRDKGLGRWVKAFNALWVLDRRPDVEFLDTWNNDSNRPMLNINEAMGFVPWKYDGEYQIEVEAAKVAAGR